MLIVDEFTGRTLHGRRYSEGLHQAIEAKEGVRIKEENQTLATITLQNYFRTLRQARRHDRYGEDRRERVRATSTRSGSCRSRRTGRRSRKDHADQIYKTEKAKYDAVVDDIAERHEAGQPILVGTVSIEKSEELSRRSCSRRGIPHEVLNAKNHFREAEIVAQAGRIGAVTVATNMAGRGVDIMLGGNPEALATAMRRKAAGPPTRRPAKPTRRTRPPTTRRWSAPSCEVQGPRATRSASSAACTSWAPSATSRAASTTSCAAAPAARATPVSRASTCRSKTT